MPPAPWQRVALTILAIAACLSIIQLDHGMATPRSPRDRMLAALDPARAGGGAPIAGVAVAAYSSTKSLRDLAAGAPATVSNVHPALPLLKASRAPAPQA